MADLLGSMIIDQAEIKPLGSLHPMFMGGNYLPNTVINEIVIARIVIQSTTFDVTCLYAAANSGKIRYRIIDEYDGATLRDENEMVSEQPLTFGGMTTFFLGASSPVDILEMNFENNLAAALDFYSVTSEFYPDFDAACTDIVIGAFHERMEDDQ